MKNNINIKKYYLIPFEIITVIMMIMLNRMQIQSTINPIAREELINRNQVAV